MRKEIGQVFCKHLTTNKVWAGLHWAERKRFKDDLRANFQQSMMMDIQPFDEKVDIFLKPLAGKGQRMFDTSNYSIMLKAIEDCIVECGLLIDDSRDYVSSVTLLPAVRAQDTGMLICLKSACKALDPFV